MKTLFFLLMVLFSTAQAIAEERELYAYLTDNVPKVGETQEVFLGDRMLAQREGQWRECLTPIDTLERSANMGMARVIHKGGEPLCKRSATGKKDRYYANYSNWIQGSDGFNYEVQWKPKKNKSKLCICQMGFCTACIKKITQDQVEEKIAFVYKSNTVQQAIEYTGRNENILTFTYSEFMDGYAREAFNREFQVDLDKGNIVAFKGAVLEIMEATNIQITYKVIRNFQNS
ncbi:hypothetical protein OAR95_00260 [Pseudomonadales bacterium]|jgi:hypothetical protein|nr:hypothetical protein [Pseudomonadales bacterium]